MALVLTATDIQSPTRWRWLLSDETGASCADRVVDLDPASAQVAALRDLTALAGPAGTADIAALGEWIGREIFGPTLWAYLDDVVVVVALPPAAGFLTGYPLELAASEGRSLNDRLVTLVYEFTGSGPGAGARLKEPVGDVLRILALYSAPTREAPLNLRQERFAFATAVRRIESRLRRSVELRVLQYGVTRERLRTVAEEYPGWDILHVSAHGLLGSLVLEDAAGAPDPVPTAELIDLLTPDRRRLKFVTLAVCDSGAAAAAEVLDTAGLEDPAAKALAAAEHPAPGPVEGLAQGFVRQLDAVVLAMRYPVNDRFAAALAGSLYPRLLEQRLPVARALTLALPEALAQASGPGLSAAVPMLYGAQAEHLVLNPPSGTVSLDPAAVRMAGFDPEPDIFVGRTATLAAAGALLAPDSGAAGVLFLGRRGTGTTSCALELAYQLQDRFGALAWCRLPRGEDLTAGFTALAATLRTQLGIVNVPDLSRPADLAAFLPALRRLLRESSLLLVLDDAGALLTAQAGWRAPLWSDIFDTLTGHGGDSRLILTGDVTPPGLDARRLRVLPVGRLTLLEELQAVMQRDPAAPGIGGAQARRMLTLAGGHPMLLTLADRATRSSSGVSADPGEAADQRLHETLVARIDAGDDWDTIAGHLQRALHGEGA
ncbi:CHAT domain-containing protein [Dactylosporangium sp. NPDC050588]|uniref:CHAT domain-containing protein n=1 Tax=Dactylosporangium sp. NPDC050588 TaxID=3157211 RepID=UPI0033E581DB